ncbi:MAG: hypothetical protein KUG83_04150, partial [Gammaproteobacteria bacterium]|nr:hypothetical protein [Gammaproteobacteria bacterium]
NVSAHTIYLINLLKNVSAQNRGANYTPLKLYVNKFFSVIQELVDQSRRIPAPFSSKEAANYTPMELPVNKSFQNSSTGSFESHPSLSRRARIMLFY